MSGPVPRIPGFVLVATTAGPHGWHLVDHATRQGAVVTKCNLTGRVITEEQRTITPCETCQATL